MMKILFFLLFSFLYINKKINYGFIYIYLFMMYMFIGLMFTSSINKILNKMMMLDSLSLLLLILSTWVMMLMILSSGSIFFKSNSGDNFILMISLLLLSLLMSFMSMNLLMFYFFFEFSLIPTLILIMGWGYQPERIQAGIYFLFYTLTASLPLLLMLILINKKLFTLNYLFFINFYCSSLMSYFVMFSLLMAFLVKMPVFMFHLWLPKAHVEAPVAGSMILAGVLLKLGGFGLCRVLKLISLNLLKINSYLIGLSLFSMIYVGLICCRMSDLKALVAYSSVAHMGLVICGIFSYYMVGLTGCLLMLVAHGISSSGLFCIVNMFYERSHSRSIFLNKGLMLTSSIFTLMFFMLCISNVSAPPSINLLSEILLMSSIMSVDFFMVMVFPLGSFLGMIFTMYMYSYTQHGKLYNFSFSGLVPSMNEFNVLMLHIIPLNFLILKSEVFVY